MLNVLIRPSHFGSGIRPALSGSRTRKTTRGRAPILLFGLAFFALATPAVRANPDWIYQRELTVTSTRATDAAGFQVLVELNPGNFDYSHANADGSDLRLASTSGAETFDLDHFIETWTPGGTSRIWARVPNIPASGTMSIFLRFGNPAAATTSNFATTFPNAFVSSGAANLGGVQNFDWFEVKAGDTITVTAGAALEVTARNVIVAGTVNANGAGSAGGPAGSGSGATGSGPGGGTPANPMNSGSGGGSYGGVGGAGGLDPGDAPGTGGALHGTTTGTDFALGSGGGASDSNFGGNGGGAISIIAQDLAVSGTLRSEGGSAQQPGGGRGGGGGSGGSIVLTGFRLAATGTLSAKGGGGSIGTAASNDDGGGGGGGRIKLFGEASLDNTAVLNVDGGAGGPNGTGGAGQTGGVGTTHSDLVTVNFEEITVAVGPEITGATSATIAQPKRFKATLVRKKSRPQLLRMTNPGFLPLSAISARTQGKSARDFRLKVPSTTLAPGASMVLSVTFKPSKKGSRKASLIVSSNVSSTTLRLVGVGK
jgi:hypothetical protein